MVAPTRAPQSRGVKCDLCKKILLKATWLDQTKPARNTEEAVSVLGLIQQHQSDGCPCMPKNIENLLIGSTHFEIHRLVARQMDTRVHSKHCEHFNESRRQSQKGNQNTPQGIINDCKLDTKSSRFKTSIYQCDQKYHDISKQQLDHLAKAIDAWCEAMEDQANPFNSKLALRLGLTHHVIYACYLFKYYHLPLYQLLTANLLFNLFRSIEGVTANAILHANFLLVKTLIDCDQLKLARQYLDQAAKIPNYQDKTHYESILLTCASCELSILDGLGDQSDLLATMADIATIHPDDKLQHYYARTYAMTVIIRYMHFYKLRSDLCFEFYHTFRYVCAIVRRCYENSFELVLSEKEPQRSRSSESQPNQILDHSWIRFAVCDLTYSTLDLLKNFYSRAGTPESLELLYNGLDLIAYRNGSHFWQSKLASIGAQLDKLCSKHEQAQKKLDVISKIVRHASDPCSMNLLRLELELSSCELLEPQKHATTKDFILELLARFRTCRTRLGEKLEEIELYDFVSNTRTKIVDEPTSGLVVLGRSLDLRQFCLRSIKVCVHSSIAAGRQQDARDIIMELAAQLAGSERQVLEFYECHIVLETLLYFCDICNVDTQIIQAVNGSSLFLTIGDDLQTLESRLSLLTVSDETRPLRRRPTTKRPVKTKSRLTKSSRLKRATYEMGNLDDLSDTIELVKRFDKLSVEEILMGYFKNSEPNPDYLLYRQAHELMFCSLLKDENRNSDQILYHLLESITANTMRYRWMMFEEQQSSAHDRPSSDRCQAYVKQLGFNGILTNCERALKSLVKSIPEDWLLLQFKYIPDRKNLSEHLIILCLDGANPSDPIYLHSKRSISADDIFDQTEISEKNFETSTLPAKLSAQIGESRRILLSAQNRPRTELRQKIENEIGIILHDMETEWLGPFKVLLCGKSCDPRYNKFIQNLIEEIQTIMHGHDCRSLLGLRLTLQNAPLISRDDFFSVIASLYDIPATPSSEVLRECFNRWQKSTETFLSEHHPTLNNNKIALVQGLRRGQVGLILDRTLEHLPFESLPASRILKQGIFRIPSMRILRALLASPGSNCMKASSDEVAFILDPASNLGRTRERFESRLKSIKGWVGSINKPPETEDLEGWLTSRAVYLFIGHGAGSVYYNKLNKGRGLHSMPTIKPVSIVMGCSSGRVQAEGPDLEPFGINWAFILRGSPCYVGLLWDVTDTDIDRFLDYLLSYWMGSKWKREDSGDGAMIENKTIPITVACARAKHNCLLKFLVGATPVVYGLPIGCS